MADDLEFMYKKMKEQYEQLVNRERELTERIKTIRDLREKIKTKQVAVTQLEKELQQLM